MGFVRFAYLFKWFLIVNLQVICIQFDTQELFVYLIYIFHELLDVRLILLGNSVGFVQYFTGTLCFKQLFMSPSELSSGPLKVRLLVLHAKLVSLFVEQAYVSIEQ